MLFNTVSQSISVKILPTKQYMQYYLDPLSQGLVMEKNF